MKLVIATPLYPPESGGPATYAKLLEAGLPEHGIDVQVVTFAEVRRYGKATRHLRYMFAVRKALKNADAVLALDPVSTGFPAALAALTSGKPFLLKIVGDYAWEQGKQRFGITASLDDFVRMGRVPFPVAVLRSVETWVAHCARLVIVPSEYLKGTVAAWGIAPEKIRVVHNAIALVEEGSVPEEVESLPHLRVISVARLVPWKGLDGLIEAVADVRRTGTSLSLVIVGDGPERERLEELARTRLGTDYVLTGALPPPEVRATLAAADIFALNSTYEGLSHVLIEALASGLPIVATRAGGNPEVVNDDSGVLISVGDTAALAKALQGLSTDAARRERLGSAASERATDFSVPVMLERTKQVLTSVL